MELTARFRVNRPKIINQTIEGEAVIINLETGIYYSLLDTGAYIWDLVEGARSLDEIVSALEQRYTGTRELFTEAVTGFLGELQAEGLIGLDAGDAESLEGAPASLNAPGHAARAAFTAPTLAKYEDMRDLMLLDPVHEVDEQAGWPHVKSEPQ